MVFPISFALPIEMFMNPNIEDKKYKFAPMIPGKKETYIYKTEKEYYKQYNLSKFGITKSKAGHDCLRHYEIIAAGAIPYFENMDKIPKTTMHNFPKDIVKRAMQNQDDPEVYKQCLDQLQKYARENLTTRALAKYFLKTLRSNNKEFNLNIPKILMVSQPHSGARTDYQRDCLSIGLVKEIGNSIDFYEDLYWLFDDYKDCIEKNYGKGFSVCGKLDNKFHNKKSKEDVITNINNNYYDIIVLATSSNMSQLNNEIVDTLSNSKYDNIVLVMGNDGYQYSKNNIINYRNNEYKKLAPKIKYIFCREYKS